MFCPPLDRTLVLSIWEDTHNFDRSVEVLHELTTTAEKSAEREKEEVSGSDIDELVYEKVKESCAVAHATPILHANVDVGKTQCSACKKSKEIDTSTISGDFV